MFLFLKFKVPFEGRRRSLNTLYINNTVLFPGNRKRIDNNMRVVVPSGGPRGKSHSTQELYYLGLILSTIRLKSYLKEELQIFMHLNFNRIFFTTFSE